jgi:hypothetical protein
MSCRTGPLRAGRAFARLFNLSLRGEPHRHPPSRWSGQSSSDQPRTHDNHHHTTGIHARKWPPHAQWTRPAGHVLTVHQTLRVKKKRPLIRGANLPWFSLVRRGFCECDLSRYLGKLAGGTGKPNPLQPYRPGGGPTGCSPVEVKLPSGRFLERCRWTLSFHPSSPGCCAIV